MDPCLLSVGELAQSIWGVSKMNVLFVVRSVIDMIRGGNTGVAEITA